MIENDGSISMQIPADEVTWFSFLQISRALNSKQGGWNLKSHWVQRGLNSLVGEKGTAFIEKWTKASLDAQTAPIPRTSDFRFEDRQKTLSERGPRGEEFSENRLNFNLSLFLSELKYPPSHPLRLVTYELPLADVSDGQLKADIVVFDQTGFVEIIELKKSGLDNPDTPLMALTEAICYTLQLVRCWSKLNTYLEERSSVKWSVVQEVSIVLAAPDYWNNCKPGGMGTDKRSISEVESKALYEIVKTVEKCLRTHLKRPELILTLTLADMVQDGKQGLKAIEIGGIAQRPPKRSVLSFRSV